MSAMFKDQVIEFWDLKLPRVKEIIQTRVPLIQIKDQHMDISFFLEDNTIAHFEFESGGTTEDDQIRYGHYDLELYNQHRRQVHRIIIYAAGVTRGAPPLSIGSIIQKQTAIYLGEDYDGDEVLPRVKEKILAGDPLDNLDRMNIMLLPMMKSQRATLSQRAVEMTDILVQYPEENTRYFLIGMMVAANYNGLDDPAKKKILEVLKMAQPFQELYSEFEEKGRKEGKKEGRKEGKKEGRKEGKKEGRKEGRKVGRIEGRERVALAALKEQLDMDTISRITGLKKDRILELKKELLK